ncbi:hypothetical protein BDW22DRAFT_1349921 [Trametopsis cervina]|nr:hypothetical protein BDW22DRAFT_1349921 [Trametopsis cervina]
MPTYGALWHFGYLRHLSEETFGYICRPTSVHASMCQADGGLLGYSPQGGPHRTPLLHYSSSCGCVGAQRCGPSEYVTHAPSLRTSYPRTYIVHVRQMSDALNWTISEHGILQSHVAASEIFSSLKRRYLLAPLATSMPSREMYSQQCKGRRPN